MRTTHDIRPDEGQRIQNTGSEAIQPNEQQSVEGSENRSRRRIAPQHIDLLPENQDFRLKKLAGQCSPQQYENVDHWA
jgi:hypothetical protein